MRFFIVGGCPVCIGAGDLLALKSKRDNVVFCYCPGCGLAWHEIPLDFDEKNSVHEIAPHGVVPANESDLAIFKITKCESTDVYRDLKDIGISEFKN